MGRALQFAALLAAAGLAAGCAVRYTSRVSCARYGDHAAVAVFLHAASEGLEVCTPERCDVVIGDVCTISRDKGAGR